MKSKLIITAFCLSLAACSNDDGDSKNEATKNPSETYQLIQKPDLTPDQIKEIRTIMTKVLRLPDNHILLPRSNESADSRKEREERIGKLSAESQQVYKQIKETCSTEQADSESNGDSRVAGDQKTEKQHQFLSGDQCPLSYDEKTSSEQTVTESSLSEIEKEAEKGTDASATFVFKLNLSSTTNLSTQIKDKDLQQVLGFDSSESTLRTTGNYAISGPLQESKTQTLGEMTWMTKESGKVTASVKNEELKRGEDQQDSYTEAQFQFPNSNPVVQSFKSFGAEKKYYLNGKEMSQKQLQEIFGPDFRF